MCLSLFPWALFRTTKSAVKMHTLLDLRGNIPSFIHISDGKLHDVNVLDVLVLEAGAIYVMDRGYLDFARLYLIHQAQAFFVEHAASAPLFGPRRPQHGHHLRSDRRADRIHQLPGLSGAFAANPLQGSRDGQDASVSHQQLHVFGSRHLRTVQAALAGGTVFQVDQAAFAYQEVLRQFREFGEVANMDRGFSLCARCYRQEAPQSGRLALHFITDIVAHSVRENALATSVYGKGIHYNTGNTLQAIESIGVLTGQQ